MEQKKLSQREQERFDRAKKDFEQSALSEQYRAWLDQAVESYSFYDGRQLKQQEIDELTANSQVPISINKIKPKINNIAGIEIKSRTKLKYLARSFDEEEKNTGIALSDLAYFQQEKEQSTHKLSKVSQDGRICGLGWHSFDIEDGVITELNEDPFHFVYDTSDDTDDLTDQNFVCKLTWTEVEDAKSAFEDNDDFFDKLAASKKKPKVKGLRSIDSVDDYGFDEEVSLFNGVYNDEKFNRVLIVEYQYRELVPMYTAITNEGKVIETFDEEEAKKLAKDKKSIIEGEGYRVSSTYFCDDLFLQDSELDQQIDMRKGEFLYTPYVYAREKLTKVPYGAVKEAITPQRLYNKKSSKLLWLMSSRQIIAEENAIEDLDEFIQEAAKPDGILMVKAGGLGKVNLDRNLPEIQSHANAIIQHDQEIKDALGIFDESLGQQTNATSGVAIERRQIGTVNTQILPLDRFRAMKQRYGIKLLKLMRVTFTEEVAFYIVDDRQEVKQIRLNETHIDENGKTIKDKAGNPIIKNDIRVGRYDLFIQEVPDVSTQLEEAAEKVFKLLQSGVQITPGVLELFGVPRSLEIYNELTKQPDSGDNGDAAPAEGGEQAGGANIQQVISQLTGRAGGQPTQ